MVAPVSRQPPPITNPAEFVTTGREAASHAAQRRREVIHDLKTEGMTFDTLLLVAEIDPPIARMRLSKAIGALPHWNVRTTGDLLAAYKIDIKTRLGWLITSPRGRSVATELTGKINLGPGGRPPLPPQWPIHGRCDWMEQHP